MTDNTDLKGKLNFINNYIKALYYIQIQIYESCNNFNETTNNMINFLENDFKNKLILKENMNKEQNYKGLNMNFPYDSNDVFNRNNYEDYNIMKTSSSLMDGNSNNYGAYKYPNRNNMINFLNSYNYPKTSSANYGYTSTSDMKMIGDFMKKNDFGSNNINVNNPPNVNNYSNLNYNNQQNSQNLKNEEVKEKNENDNLIRKKKEKFFEMKKKNSKKFFQIVYLFKNKIKRMYRIDSMTRKINVNLYNFLKENADKLKINDDLLEFFKNNIRYTSKHKFFELDKKYPNFRNIYEEFLKSEKFKKMINIIKTKHDEEYLKLFFRHAKNFLNLYIKDTPYCKIGRRLGVKPGNKITNQENKTQSEIHINNSANNQI